jgi:uncharacterized protein
LTLDYRHQSFTRRLLRRPAALPLLVLSLMLVGGCAFVESKQGEWIFRPTTSTWWGARELPPNITELNIPVPVAPGGPNEDVHAWWAPLTDVNGRPVENAPVLLYLHGARWNLSGSATRIPRWNKMGFSVLAIDYRGFGKSSPRSPTEQSANEDTEAAWQYLSRLAPQSRKFIFGHSLGGAMATHLALLHPDADGLILEGTFTSIPDMVKETRFGFLPVGGLITQRFDNLDRIDDVKVPLLVAHGTEDTIVPFAMGEKVFAAATARKRFFRAEGGSHHNLTSRFFDAYAQAVQEHFALQPPVRQASLSSVKTAP